MKDARNFRMSQNCQVVPVTGSPGEGGGGEEPPEGEPTPPGGEEPSPPPGEEPPPPPGEEPPPPPPPGGDPAPAPEGDETTSPPDAEETDPPPDTVEPPPEGGEPSPEGEHPSPDGGTPVETTQCIGDVSFKLLYKATASTEDPQFLEIGVGYNLYYPSVAAPQSVAELAGGVGSPTDPQAMTLTGEMELGSVPCTGGQLTGTVEVAMIIPQTGTVFLQQVITYDASVAECGMVTINALDLEQLSPVPGMRPAEDFPAIQIGSNFEEEPEGGWPSGYPPQGGEGEDGEGEGEGD